ncbi:MAG: hydrogenase maturation nickel metallochaperone HypA [Candidatus Aenigmatarchaeota archaeon]|nr:MAG: hydrogenase maturation nickel metallochaperone HypA [Candidatus Aenigmarchaeota archaeon]
MHEFGSVQKAIQDIRKMKPVPKKVKIVLGKMRGSAKAFEEMFREYTRETELECIELKIEQVPVKIKCECGLEGLVRVTEHVHFARCPKCGQVADVLQGNELKIVSE